MELRIPLADLDYGLDETQAVIDVLKSRWLTMGTITQEFEHQFASMLGVKHAFGVSNGTHALHLACLATGIKPEDEVIVPSLTFVATVNAALYVGASIKFADILGVNDLNISPQSIEECITPKTKAIILVHYGGYGCQMHEIMALAQEHKLIVIEDAAHAPGAYLDQLALGTWGDAGCFSFFSNKNLATGEGGMIVTNRDDIAEKLKVLRSHGMTTLTWDRHQGHAYSYDVVALGNNFRIDEIRSSLGLVQLKKLEANNLRRSEHTTLYRELICNTPGCEDIEIPFLDHPGCSACHIFPVLLPENVNRLQLMTAMRSLGVQTSIHYPPVHKFSYYQELYPGVDLPHTENIAKREVTLPLYPNLSAEDIVYVVNSLQEALVQTRENGQ